MSISHEEAMSALQAGLAKAQEMGVQLAIAIVDDHADLVAMIKMTDARFLFLPQAAQGKAMASVVWGQPSAALFERASAPIMVATNASVYNNKLFYQGGAVPFKRDGKIAGAVGAGGASPQQDEDVARVVAELLGEV
ncbi:MAG: heme-binding protein [Dehalococcoidia bacterium]